MKFVGNDVVFSVNKYGVGDRMYFIQLGDFVLLVFQIIYVRLGQFISFNSSQLFIVVLVQVDVQYFEVFIFVFFVYFYYVGVFLLVGFVLVCLKIEQNNFFFEI